MIEPIISNARVTLVLIVQAPMLLCAKHSMELVARRLAVKGQKFKLRHYNLTRGIEGLTRCMSQLSLRTEISFAAQMRTAVRICVLRHYREAGMLRHPITG